MIVYEDELDPSNELIGLYPYEIDLTLLWQRVWQLALIQCPSNY